MGSWCLLTSNEKKSVVELGHSDLANPENNDSKILVRKKLQEVHRFSKIDSKTLLLFYDLDLYSGPI